MVSACSKDETAMWIIHATIHQIKFDNTQIDPTCLLCNKDNETVMYCLLECSIVVYDKVSSTVMVWHIGLLLGNVLYIWTLNKKLK